MNSFPLFTASEEEIFFVGSNYESSSLSFIPENGPGKQALMSAKHLTRNKEAAP